MSSPELLHSNCLRLGNKGILLLGKSGVGKSTLCLALLERAAWSARDAALISDDYTQLYIKKQQIFASAPESLKGLMEIRGAGLFHFAYESCVALDCAALLDDHQAKRYPDEHDLFHFRSCAIPLLKLPSLNNSHNLALCQAIEAFCFGQKSKS